VSAGLASPTDRGSVVVPRDKVRALQHTLYRAAKADPGRQFHTLWDKVLRRDVLWRGWVAVRRNDGAPGIDKFTLVRSRNTVSTGSWPRSRRSCARDVIGRCLPGRC
jgi:RNA-directed DNA polymerase